MTLLRRSIATVFLLAMAMPGFADTTLIHAGQLLAVPGKSPASRQTIVVVDDRIVAVQSGFASTDEFDGEVKVIDLSRQFVLPGLMDMHVHLQGELGPNNDSDALKMSDQLDADAQHPLRDEHLAGRIYDGSRCRFVTAGNVRYARRD